MRKFHSFFWVMNAALPVSDDARYAAKGFVAYRATSKGKAYDTLMRRTDDIKAQLPSPFDLPQYEVEPSHLVHTSRTSLVNATPLSGEDTLIDITID